MEIATQKTLNRPAATTRPAASARPVQRKAAENPGFAQLPTSLNVSSPKDSAEREAEATAKKVMRMATPAGSLANAGIQVLRQAKPEEKEKKAQRSFASPYIARFATSGVLTQRAENNERRMRRPPEDQILTSGVEAEIQSSKGMGSPLPLSVRQFMELRFRADFSKVKVHTDDKAARLSKQLNAHAFTVGSHIFFGKDRFKPDSTEGRELIAHELAHTIQQGATIQRSADDGVSPGALRGETVVIAQRSARNAQRLAISQGQDFAPKSPNTIPGIQLSSTAPRESLARASEDEKRMYRTADGKMVELPEDMTAEEAAKLEAEARAAQKKLGKGPPPQPVPDLKKLVTKEEKKGAPKPKAKGKKGEKGRGKAAPKPGAAVTSVLKVVSSTKVAQYLAAKGTPVLLKGIGMLRKLRQNEQTHDDAAEKLDQSQKAVVVPASEGQSKSNTDQVNVVGDRPAPVADESNAKRKLQDSLKENTPRTLEDVDNFKRDQKAQHMGADVMGVVLIDKGAVVSTFDDLRHTPPPTPPEQTPEALPPEEKAPPTVNMNLGESAIAPLQKEHTDLSSYTKEADSKLKEEGVTQEQLDMVDSGDLAEANKEKKGMESKAKTEPLAIQKFAQQETQRVDQDLRQEEKIERDRMKAKRKTDLGATAQKQKGAKSDLEKKREEVASKINGIYQAAQDKVKKRLADLETQSMKRFDEGNAKATKEFEDNVNRELDAFKDDRYSGVFGWARKAKDWLLGMDDLPEVKAIFDRNRAAFVSTINKLVEDISADNKRVIQECKDELANAKRKIKEFVDTLEPGLKDIGKKTAQEMEAKLDELDQFVAKKEQELQDKLKDKQTAAIKAIDEKIEKMKEAMSGALAKLGKLLLWAAKKFFTWALEKFGFSLSDIEGIIDKGVAVLKAIFTKPIQFVKNLINAAVSGFKNFGKNFLTHLKNAVFEWLAGSLQGLILPETWDMKGILSVALQMLGLTWTNIRGKLVKLMGEPVVKGLETTFTLVQTLVTQGPMAAWEQLKEMAGEAKDAFIEAVKDFIKIKIVEKAIETVISMFVPGAGIIRAIIGIYDTFVFFIQKAKDIIQMVGNFLRSIAEIVAGNIGAAADALEKGLARALKLVIDFLARLLRLSGITKKIQQAIEKIRSKVDAALDKVVKWIADKAKKIWGGIKQGVADVKESLVEWWKAKRDFRSKDGGEHKLFFRGSGKGTELMLASREAPALAKLQAAKKGADPQRIAQLDRAIDQISKIGAEIKLLENAGTPTDRKKKNLINQQIDKIKGILESCDLADVEGEVQYIIEVDRQPVTYELFGPSVKKGAVKPIDERAETAYVGNVPMYAGEPRTPTSVAEKYLAGAFTDPNQAAQRFALVIGVNISTNGDKSAEDKLRTQVNTASGWNGDNFLLGVFGFKWRLTVSKGGKDIGTVDEAIAREPASQRAKIESEVKETKSKVEAQSKKPFGVFRDAVKNHHFTSSFISMLSKQAKNVFIHVGDSDVVSLKAGGEHAADEFKNLDKLAEGVGDGLFDRYDRAIKTLTKDEEGHYPYLISGGYNISMVFVQGAKNKNATEKQKFASKLASILDMQIRRAMGKVDGKAAYLPEPNLLINVSGDTDLVLSTSFGVHENEGRTFAKNLASKRAGKPVTMAMTDVELTTETPERFVLEEGKTSQAVVQNRFFKGYLVPDLTFIRSLMNQAQSHAKPPLWANNVGLSYGMTVSEKSSNERKTNWKADVLNYYSQCHDPIKRVLNAEPPELKEFFSKKNKNITEAEARTKILNELRNANPEDIVPKRPDPDQITNYIMLVHQSEALATEVHSKVPELARESAKVLYKFISDGLET